MKIFMKILFRTAQNITLLMQAEYRLGYAFIAVTVSISTWTG